MILKEVKAKILQTRNSKILPKLTIVNKRAALLLKIQLMIKTYLIKFIDYKFRLMRKRKEVKVDNRRIQKKTMKDKKVKAKRKIFNPQTKIQTK